MHANPGGSRPPPAGDEDDDDDDDDARYSADAADELAALTVPHFPLVSLRGVNGCIHPGEAFCMQHLHCSMPAPGAPMSQGVHDIVYITIHGNT